MNKYELKSLLDKFGMPESFSFDYPTRQALNFEHEPPDRWHIYLLDEKGCLISEKYFTDEDSACRYFLEQARKTYETHEWVKHLPLVKAEYQENGLPRLQIGEGANLHSLERVMIAKVFFVLTPFLRIGSAEFRYWEAENTYCYEPMNSDEIYRRMLMRTDAAEYFSSVEEVKEIMALGFKFGFFGIPSEEVVDSKTPDNPKYVFNKMIF